MIAVALKGLAGRKVRALLTAFAVVIGVAMVSGTFVLTDTIQKAFDGIFTSSYQQTDAVIAGKEIVKGSQSGAATVPESLTLAAELRASGVRVEVYPEPDKLGKQMKYADAKGIPLAAILGGNEIARGEVTLKNLGTGTQESVPRADVSRAVVLGLGRAGKSTAAAPSE